MKCNEMTAKSCNEKQHCNVNVSCTMQLMQVVEFLVKVRYSKHQTRKMGYILAAYISDVCFKSRRPSITVFVFGYGHAYLYRRTSADIKAKLALGTQNKRHLNCTLPINAKIQACFTQAA